MNRQTEWQRAQVAKGNCRACGKPRGPDGTTTRCRVHADLCNRQRSKSRNAKLKAGLCERCGKSRGKSKSMCMCTRCLKAVRVKNAVAKPRLDTGLTTT